MATCDLTDRVREYQQATEPIDRIFAFYLQQDRGSQWTTMMRFQWVVLTGAIVLALVLGNVDSGAKPRPKPKPKPSPSPSPKPSPSPSPSPCPESCPSSNSNPNWNSSCPLCDALNWAFLTAQHCKGDTDIDLFAAQLERQLENMNGLLQDQPNNLITDAFSIVGCSISDFLDLVLMCNDPPLSGLTTQIGTLIIFLYQLDVDLSELDMKITRL